MRRISFDRSVPGCRGRRPNSPGDPHPVYRRPQLAPWAPVVTDRRSSRSVAEQPLQLCEVAASVEEVAAHGSAEVVRRQGSESGLPPPLIDDESDPAGCHRPWLDVPPLVDRPEDRAATFADRDEPPLERGHGIAVDVDGAFLVALADDPQSPLARVIPFEQRASRFGTPHPG